MERTMLGPWTNRISIRTLLIPLDSFFDMGISMTSHETSLGTVWAEGLTRGREGERGRRESWVAVGGGNVVIVWHVGLLWYVTY